MKSPPNDVQHPHIINFILLYIIRRIIIGFCCFQNIKIMKKSETYRIIYFGQAQTNYKLICGNGK